MTNENSAEPETPLNGFVRRYETFQRSLGAASRAKQRINDLEGLIAGSQNKLGKESAAKLLQEEYAREQPLVGQYDGEVALNSRASKGFYDEHRNNILASIEDEHFAENIYEIPPQEIEGNKEHNEKVKAHKRVLELEHALHDREKLKELIVPEMKKRVKEIEIKTEKNIRTEVEEQLRKNPDYKYWQGSDELKNYLETVTPGLVAHELRGLEITPELIVGMAKEEFLKSFADDEGGAKYARANLGRTYETADDKIKEGLIGVTYAIAKGQSLREIATRQQRG